MSLAAATVCAEVRMWRAPSGAPARPPDATPYPRAEAEGFQVARRRPEPSCHGDDCCPSLAVRAARESGAYHPDSGTGREREDVPPVVLGGRVRPGGQHGVGPGAGPGA